MTNNDIADITMATGEWGKTRAFVTVKLTCGLTLNGVKVIQGTKGLFVGMPSVQRKEKETGKMVWKDCAYLEEDEDRKSWQEIVLAAYNAKVGGSSDSTDSGFGNEEDSFFD